MRRLLVVSIACVLLSATSLAQSPKTPQSPPRLNTPSGNSGRTTDLIAEKVRHQLIMIPDYGVFDWLEAQVLPNDSVVLRGQVTRPSVKADAEYRTRKLESVTKVINQIEVLQLSPSDDAIRVAMYRSIFNYNSGLFRYANRAVPPIHIIVNNGRTTLKGVVGSPMDRQLAYFAARNVPGVFEVRNELKVDRSV